MHTGAVVEKVEQLVNIANGEHWDRAYFYGADDSPFPIEPWMLIARVRLRLADGAAGDGVMSPGAVDAWYNLAPIQEKLMGLVSGSAY